MAIAYVTIGFKRQGRKLVADQPKLSKTAQQAVDAAKRLAEIRAGVVAFEQSHDVEAEIYDDPKILYASGELPPEFEA